MNAVLSYNRNQVTLRPFDHELIDLGAVATGLTVAKASKAWHVNIRVEGYMGRFWKDGTTPTDIDGYPFFDMEQIELTQEEALLFKAIRVGALNPKLWVEYLDVRF